MNQNMDRFRVRLRSKAIFFTVLASMSLMVVNGFSQGGRAKDSHEVDQAVNKFFEDWLVKKDVDGALSLLSENPIFPSCIVDKGEGGISWGRTKREVASKLKLLLVEVFSDQKYDKVTDLFEKPSGVLYSKLGDKRDYPLLELNDSNAPYHVYLVGKELRKEIASKTCKTNRDTNSFKKGIVRHKELYLVVTNSKQANVGLTLIWGREKGKLRLLLFDVRI